MDAMPLLGAFIVGKAGVQDGDLIAEHAVQVRGSGWGESDLGNEHDGRASGGEQPLHRREIYGGLAGAGHTMQQRDGKLPLVDRGLYFRERLLLLAGEYEIKWRFDGAVRQVE